MGVIKRQGLKGSIVNYIGVGLGAIFFLLIFPNILDKKYLGFYQLIFSLTLVFAQIPLLGTANILYKYYGKWKEGKRLKAFNSFAFISVLLAGLGFALLYYLFRNFFFALYAAKSPLFIKYYFIIPPLVIIQALTYYLEFYSMMKLRVAIPTFIREVVVRILLIILFAFLAFEMLSEDLFVGIYMAVFFISFCFLFYYAYRFFDFRFGRAKNFRKDNKDLKEQFNYGTNATAIAFISNLQNFADAIILPIYMGLGALGIYGRPLILGQMISIPYRSIAYIASPIIMEAWHNNDVKKIEDLNKKLSINLLLIGLFLFSVIVVNADNFFNVLPPIYKQGQNVLYIIAFGRLLDMSFGLNSEILFSSKYYRWIVWFTLFTLMITIGLNMYLIPIIGMEGAAIAVTAALILFNILKNILIYVKFGFHCFSKHYLTLIVISAVAILIALMLPNFYSEGLNETAGTNIASVILNTIFKSIVVALVFIIPTLYFKVSEDFNSFFKLIISGKIFKGGHKMEEL